ncbi:MAG: phosphodiester glycosidase family protein [Patescibacteria group bacterium]
MRNKSKALFLISILVILGVIFLRNLVSLQNDEEQKLSPSPTVIQTENPKTTDLTINEEEFKVAWVKIGDTKNLKLFPNFTEKLTAKKAKENTQCSTLISGGFYTEDSTPTGLFISEGRQLKSHIRNQLFDGVFSIDYNEKPKITSFFPEENLRLGLQTGPTLMKDGESTSLNLVSDKPARRVVIALTEDHSIVFLAFYKKDSVFLGPKLENLPVSVKYTSDKIGLKIVDALNLDGGSASAFITKDTQLSELTPIGSYFCIR